MSQASAALHSLYEAVDPLMPMALCARAGKATVIGGFLNH